jgi:hypothetical protein
MAMPVPAAASCCAVLLLNRDTLLRPSPAADLLLTCPNFLVDVPLLLLLLGANPAPYDYTPFFYSREFNLSWQFYGQSDAADDVITRGDLSPAAAAAAAAPEGQAPRFGAYFVKGGAVVGVFVEGPTADESAAFKAIVRAKPAAPAAAVLKAEGGGWAVAAASKL